MNFGYPWHLKEWLAIRGKIADDLVKDLGWNKGKVSLVVNDQQRIKGDELAELAVYLEAEPFELLMHPDRAMRLRRIQEDMIRLAREAEGR